MASANTLSVAGLLAVARDQFVHTNHEDVGSLVVVVVD